MSTRIPTHEASPFDDALAGFRARFDHASLAGYLDTASHAPRAHDHRAAIERYLHSFGHGAAPWGGAWQEAHDLLVARTAALLGARVGSVVLAPSASHALLGVLSALRPEGERRDVVLLGREWVSNRHVVAADGRFRAVVVPDDADEGAEALLARIDERTRLVVVSWVCFRTGRHADLGAIVRRAREAGAMVFADTFQAAGATRVDVGASGVDFAAGGYLKHLLGAPGVAWLYARDRDDDALRPTLTGWRGQADPMHPELAPAAGAGRFGVGTWPVPSVYLALAGLDLIDAAGAACIADQVAHLAARFADAAAGAGFTVRTPPASARKGPIVVLACADAVAVAGSLARRGVVLTARDATLRASFHAHLRGRDVDDAVDALREALVA